MPYLTAKSSSKETKYDLYAPETIDASGYPDGGWFRRLRLSGAGKILETPLTRIYETHTSLETGRTKSRLSNGRYWNTYVAPPLEPQEYVTGGYWPYRLARLANLITVTTPGYKYTTVTGGGGSYSSSSSGSSIISTYVEKSTWKSLFPLKKDLVIVLTSRPGYGNPKAWGSYERFENCWYAKAGESGGELTAQTTDYDFRKIGSARKEQICLYLYYPTDETNRFDIGWSWTGGQKDNKLVLGPRINGGVNRSNYKYIKGNSYSGIIHSATFKYSYFFAHLLWVEGWSCEFSVIETDYKIYTAQPKNALYGSGHHATVKTGNNHTEIVGWRNFAVLKSTGTPVQRQAYNQNSLTFTVQEPD